MGFKALSVPLKSLPKKLIALFPLHSYMCTEIRTPYLAES